MESSEESLEEINKKELIKHILSIDIGAEQQAQMIMVLLELKPATDLCLYSWNSSPEKTEAELNKTGLLYVKKENKKQYNTIAEYAISKDEQIIKKLLDCKSPTEYGQLMGYPETAIQAFEAKNTYKGPLPEDIERSIFKMAFSSEHLEEEFETIREWNTALKKYAPDWKNPRID